MSTIHPSKWLEFDSVYMIDLINGDKPSSINIDLYEDGVLDALEEERRLFYVGITRAKRNLILLH